MKPSRADITTNPILTTDRRNYMVELRSGEKHMPAVAWAYPERPGRGRQAIPATVGFPGGIVQGEMPPIFVSGPEGEASMTTATASQSVNSRIHQHILIIDRLFGAAKLRFGGGERQQTVGIVGTDRRPTRCSSGSPN